MSIVFGWNSFKLREEEIGALQAAAIKSMAELEKERLGLPDDWDSGECSIEQRQKYFHLFWIPFFSLGKIWVLRLDQRLYKLPNYVGTDPQTEPSTPWYTFLGPLLIVLGLLSWGGYQWFDDYRLTQMWETRTKQKIALQHERLNDLSTHDFFKLDNQLYLKIEKITADHIVISRVSTQKAPYSSCEECRLYDYHKNNHEDFEHFQISRQELAKGLVDDLEIHRYGPLRNKSLRAGLVGADLFGDNNRYMYQWAKKLDHFVLDAKLGGWTSQGQRRFIRLSSVTEPAELISFDSLDNDLEIQNTLPMQLNRSSKFSITPIRSSKQAFKAQLVIRDYSGQRHAFNLSYNGRHKVLLEKE